MIRKLFYIISALLLMLLFVGHNNETSTVDVVTQKYSNSNPVTNEDGLEFTLLDDGTYAVTDYNNYNNSIRIPEYFEGSPVTIIGEYAFSECNNLEYIEMPYSILKIEKYAFYNCTNLYDITIPYWVESIGKGAFYGCYNLEEVKFSSSISRIGENAFGECYNLRNVYYNGTLVNWCNIQFHDAYSNPMYTNFYNSYSKHFYISDNTSNYFELRIIEIPEEITYIGNYQFSGFENVKKVKIHSGVQYIGEYAFNGYKYIICDFGSQPYNWEDSWAGYSSYVYWAANFKKVGEDKYFDSFPIIFMVMSLVGVALGLYTLYKWRFVKNKFRKVVKTLFIITIILSIGAMINGFIGCSLEFPRRHACSWICLGLGCAALLFGIITFLVQYKTVYYQPKPKEEKVIQTVEVQKESNECLFYQEFRQGAILVREDYITFYHNLLPFTKCRKGRISSIIFINDIQHIVYKGCGWFNGILIFTFKHYNKPFKLKFNKWFVWNTKKLNRKMAPIYEYIRMRVIENNK